ncbi:hypothetical protein QBC43DRAFT_317449 [Cladorrhinum sp. PSN259]|nr:hypothetical protein QBC43DRAFT_317449 [Cladorrhinum sp. PSN259]
MPHKHHYDGHGKAGEHRSRTHDDSPSSDYDTPRRRQHRNSSPLSHQRSHSSSTSHRGRYDETPAERLARSKSTGHAPPSRIHRSSPSPASRGRRSADDQSKTYTHRYHEHQSRYRSPSPANTRSRRRISSVKPGRDYNRHSSPARRHRSHPPPVKPHPHTGLSHRWQGAAAAAFQAGSLAALAMRSEPGAWNGSKGARVATAALGAGMIKAARYKPKEEPAEVDGKGRKAKMKTKGANMAGGALAGFVAKQFAKDHSGH